MSTDRQSAQPQSAEPQSADTQAPSLLTPAALLQHWQSHRKLTRRVIDAFPEDQLFQYSLGGMRPFAEMVAELLGMAVPTVRGMATGTWDSFAGTKAQTKSDLLDQWDTQTEQLNQAFPTLTAEQFAATHKAFGQWEFPGITLLQYVIDNEIHHRGEGYVYLRSLNIEPPPFWDRY